MKKSMFALACAASVAAFAEQTIGTTIGFEDYTLPFKGLSFKDDAGDSTGSFYWLYQGAAGAEDGSEVKAYDSSSTEFGANFLELSTEGGTLWRSVAPLASEALNAGTAVPDGGLYIDTMVQFTPTEDGGAPELAAGDKLAIWLNVETPEGATSPVTNLCVRAGAVSRAGMEVVTPTTFVLAGTGGIEAGKWYRLTVTAIKDVTKAVEFGEKPRGVTGFSIKLDGEELSTTSTVFDDSYIDYADWLLDSEVALLQSGKVFASLEGFVTTAQLSAVGFKGSGAIDNLTISDEDPNPPAPASIDFTITVADGVTAEWSTDGANWTAYAAATAKADAGTIQIRLTNSDGGVKVVSKDLTAENKAFDLTEETFGWAEYLGAAVDGAYVIDDQAEFGKFVAKVATLGSEGITFKLAANVAFAGVIGAANNKDNLGKDAFIAGAFKGTFDGQNNTISDVELPRADYTGLFGSLYGATVKNLTVAVKEGTTGFEAEGGTADFCGGLVAGVSVKSTIESVTTAAGTFKAQKAAAGIVGYAAGGTVLKDCVNNLNVISMGNEKVAGLVGCAQNTGSYTPAYVTIDGCTNNGNVECQASGKSRAALLVSYSDCEVKFQGNVTAKGTVTQAGSTANIQSIININGGSATVVDGAVIKAPATMKSTIHNSKAHAGLNYATVADGVATFVADSAAVNGANLKVMTTGNTITLANVGDSITLDTTLATATVTTTAEDAYVAKSGNVYTVTAKADAEFTVTIDPTEAEWTAELELPTPTITGTTATGSWSPATIVEPDAGTTNTYTYTVTVAATDTTKETTKSVEFKVYKNATVVYPEYIGEDAEKRAKYEAWAKANNIEDFADTAKANEAAYLLNVAPSESADEAAAFKIVSISIDADGKVTVIAPAANTKKAAFNGTVEVKGCATVDGEYTLPITDSAARFFKAFLK